MPKFLTGCHYNEEEISRHLRKNIGYWPVQINGNKFATGQILEKTSRSCEGADFSWLSSKVSRNLQCASQFADVVPIIAHMAEGRGWTPPLPHPPSSSRALVENFHLAPRKDMQRPSSSILGLLGEEEDRC